MLQNTSIKKFDDILRMSSLNFSKVEYEDMDYYQRTSTMDLNYIYLRNNLNIENLSKNDLELLESLECDSLVNVTDDLNELIRRTYKNVINPSYGNKKYICYGPSIGKYLASSDDLVLGIRYNEFEENNLTDDEWFDNSIAQNEKLKEICEALEQVLSSELNVNVKCIRYDEFNISDNYSYYK